MINGVKTVSVLGSTGSIGEQTIDVIAKLGEKVNIAYLSANTNINRLEQQALEFNPIGVCISDFESYNKFKASTRFKGEILFGSEGLNQIASYSENDLVLSALVGFMGVEPALNALRQGTNLALANKETLVSAGKLVTATAKANDAEIIAVDSEHSAILQCLIGENTSSIDFIELTASGGPFRTLPADKFSEITVADALKHPNWEMGGKITIDSATMMNKGLEVIEARWLFDLSSDKIKVVIHPQSIIHSLVHFCDGSVKAQLGLPDMRIPISFSLFYPERLDFDFPRLKLSELQTLTFEAPDYDKFRCLQLAYEALDSGGVAPAVLNAANEVANLAFRQGKIKFVDIPKVIEQTLAKIENLSDDNLDNVLNSDIEARKIAEQIIKTLY